MGPLRRDFVLQRAHFSQSQPKFQRFSEDRGEIGRIEILDATGRGYPSPIRLEH